MYQTARNDTVNKIANAFPEIDSIVEFTKDKYDDGYKMISSSNVVSYSMLDDSKISIGSAVGTYRLSDNTMTIEFKDIATVSLSRIK